MMVWGIFNSERLNNEQGIAFILVLGVMAVLLVFSTAFAARTVYEMRTAEKELEVTKAFYLAEAGTQAGIDQLDLLVNNYMTNTINAMNPFAVINLAQQNLSDGIGFLVATVQNNGTVQLTRNGSQAEYQRSNTNLGQGNYNYTIIITQKTNPVTVTTNTWDFPYNYRIEGTGANQGEDRKVFLSGDFTVRVRRDNFARYALFTNNQAMPNGTYVWFTDSTNFAGPLHTNGRYNIALNPSGRFEAIVEQMDARARFYNSGWPILLNADRNGNRDVPTFRVAFNRGRSTIALSSPTQQQDMINQATGGQTIQRNGVHVPNNGQALTGAIFVRGNADVTVGEDRSNHAEYRINQGGTLTTITVDQGNRQTTVDTQIGRRSSSQTYNGLPDGIDNVGTLIYVDGRIDSLGGTIEERTALTIASSDDVVIRDHLRYERYSSATGRPGDPNYVAPSAAGTQNLLGVVSWNGNVRIDAAAPNNVEIHGTILARNGILQVDRYDDQRRGSRGTATILGGVITNNYGAFGLFNGRTGQQLSGYGRNFVYDERMQQGSSPPYFPTLSTFVASTNDIADKTVWQEGGL